MYMLTPTTWSSDDWSRRITSLAWMSRLPSPEPNGFRLISIRPLFSVALVPSTPMNDDRLSTAGSCSTIFAISCWRSAIAENEIDCCASVMPWMAPVSWTGKKPFGIRMYSSTVSASVATATSSVIGW